LRVEPGGTTLAITDAKRRLKTQTKQSLNGAKANGADGY